MTYLEWRDWDLEQPVPIKHSFWMLHPNIILWAMRAWIIADHKVTIPYRWTAIGYNGGEHFEAPEQPKKEENYKELTMFDVEKKCEAYMSTKWSDKHRKGSELARYPKMIADVKRDLVVIEEKITEAKSNLSMID